MTVAREALTTKLVLAVLEEAARVGPLASVARVASVAAAGQDKAREREAAGLRMAHLA
jgi:hypothetical protein